MERLIVYETDKGNYAVRPEHWAGIIDKNWRIKECGLNHTAIFHYKKDAEWYADAKNAEEQGLLLRLPCKIGSTLYDIIDFVEGNNFPEIYVIDASKIEVSKDKKGILYTIDCTDFRENDFGTTVFSSMEEATQALAKMKEV